MIDELHVRDVALIRDATLTPARGLTVITGETGAGKTALLAALKLLVGERADASLVREGAQEARVEGRVFPLRARGEQDGEGTVVQRTLSADGRSRVHIDGAIGSVGQLAAQVGSTVDLCGQHEHQRLLRTTEHRAMLDAWGGPDIERALERYRHCWQAAANAAQRLAAVEEAGKLGAEAVDQARYTLRRIDEVDPSPDEYDELAARVPLLENAESLLQAAQGAREALSAERGALDALGQAASLLESQARVDAALGELAASLRESSYVVEDVAREVERYADGIEYDPQLLASLQDRMGALQDLMRTWGPGMAEVMAAREEAARTVAAVDGHDEQLRAAQHDLEHAEEALAKAAEGLHARREQLAPDFAQAVCRQMANLELGNARLVCEVSTLDRAHWSASGPDKVEFLFMPGAGMQARPLAKIASGGEVSRVMLAVKVVLGSADQAETLVFDEVDAGVGGEAARALAGVLAGLAETHQVIVVTHLAQVAVRAQEHYVVRKLELDAPETQLSRVAGQERVEEVARMLSGDASEAALAHAELLLAQARQAKDK